MDPRVKTSTVSLEKKFQAETHLAAIVSQSSEAILQAGSIRGQMQKLSDRSNPASKDALETLQKKLSTILGASGAFFAPPSDEVTLSRVNGQASSLYAQLWQVDAEPSFAQTEAMQNIERDHADVMKRWNEFKTSNLPALNRQLRQAGLSEINLKSKNFFAQAHTNRRRVRAKTHPILSPPNQRHPHRGFRLLSQNSWLPLQEFATCNIRGCSFLQTYAYSKNSYEFHVTTGPKQS